MQPTVPVPVQREMAPASGDLEVLLVRLGPRVFGVPLSHVRYVAPMPADFASAGADAAEHFVFEGEPLGYISLWDTLGQPSLYAEYGEMQAMLPQRRQDHLDWMAALENSIRTGVPFAKARSPRECAFGKWFYAYQSHDRRLGLLLSQFEQPHAAIHALADRLLGMKEAGQGSEALTAFEQARDTTLATLMKLFDSAGQLVVDLQRRVAIIVAEGDATCALGTDGVVDIVVVPPERAKHGSGKATSRATSGLVLLEDQSVVPLLDWRAFDTGADAIADGHP
ncbi:MAG: CZB domain-containing protein [Sterolibacteriaceae bacterium MAG5]|nr:CZB domain-containing protein [Candidatus Nitricoxidireducens bremensis]